MPYKDKEKEKEYKRQHYLENRELYILRARESKKRNPQKSKDNYYKHKEKRLKSQKEYREKNKDRIREQKREYYQRTKEKFHEKRMEYQREHRASNINKKLKDSISLRIYKAIKGKRRSESIKKYLGCSIEQYKEYLEGLFHEDMAWENYGEWHIDHIIPCRMFDLTKESQMKICFNYQNTQPLWAIDNLRKGGRPSTI